jgi:prolyl 4-hydroxylase
MNPTPEVSRWIDEQLARGCGVTDMVAAMTKVGHSAAFAQQVIHDAVARLDARTRSGGAQLAVPEPLEQPITHGACQIDVGDRSVSVLASIRQPRLVLLSNLLSDEECDALICEARPKLQRSYTVNRKDGGNELNAARTSEGTYFFHDESPLLVRINSRIARLTRWPLENGEPLQILHYGPGAHYEPHFDYFDPSDPGTANLVARGGQRVATLIMYLNNVECGGATIFPGLALEVAPIRGNAVFFSYDRAHPDTGTLHGGTPVTRGEKWIATRWMRERPYR